MILLSVTTVGFAQTQEQVEFDPDNKTYATGLILPTHDEIASAKPMPLTRAYLPEVADLSDRFPAVGDQGRLGSCVSWAVGYAVRSYYTGLVKSGKMSSADIPSPAYMHGILRVPDPNDAPCGGGANIGAAFRLLNSEGAASLKASPYSDRRCGPPAEELRRLTQQKRTFRIDNYVEISSTDGTSAEIIDKIKTQLARGHPVVTGIDVSASFQRLRGRKVWTRKSSEKISGSHAIALVGYDEKGQYFKFINSWGRGWGDRGYGRLSYETLMADFRIGYSMRISDAQPVPAPEPLPSPEPTPEPVPPPDPVIGDFVIPSVSCGSVQLKTQDGQTNLIGYVRDAADLDKLRAAVGDKPINIDVAVRPWPQCETLTTLRDPLKDTGKPSVTIAKAKFSAGDVFSFTVGMAPFEGYLHVAYIQADGNVLNLVQAGPANLQTLGRGTTMAFGDGSDGRDKFTVSEPFGEEMVVAIASASPLFDELRPRIEVERTFLTALRKAILARPNPDLPERRISASYAIVETKGDAR